MELRGKNSTKSCLICKGYNLTPYLDLGKTALANSFLEKSDLNKKESKFPLEVYYCKDCYLAQLGNIVDRKLLFQNYAWFSSASPQLENYFENYVNDVYERFPNQTKKYVLEIASNDGILLKYFKKLGADVLGVDPAKNIARVANKNGIKTLPVFFNLDAAKKIVKKFGKAGIISANHVIAHLDDLHGTINGVRELLDKDGVFIFEVQYLGDLIKYNEFDNTYHEHTCYFSLSPLITLLNKHSLSVFDVEKVEAQGGSIRVYASHSSSPLPTSNNVRRVLAREKKQGLHKLKTYKEFSKKPKLIKKDLVKLLNRLKKQGKSIVGYGASAKGNTLLQYSGIDKKHIDYIVDDAPIKQGKFTPGSHIPIFPSSHLKKNTPDYILILSWNHAKSIMEKESWVKDRGVKFILPVPKVKII